MEGVDPNLWAFEMEAMDSTAQAHADFAARRGLDGGTPQIGDPAREHEEKES